MESSVESCGDGQRPRTPGAHPVLSIQLLGPLVIRRQGRVLALPRSRKVKSLFAYLALAERPLARSQLCELLWDFPNDPRGELRWCLSKLRSAVDEPGHRRIVTNDGTVQLDLSDCVVDAIEIGRATRAGVERIGLARQRELATLFNGEFLEGLDAGRSPAFGAWLTAQRRRFCALHATMLEALVTNASGEEAQTYLEQWLQLAPLDSRAHEAMLIALARAGRIADGEKHLATTVAVFEAERLDCRSVREVWRMERIRASGPGPQDPPAARQPACGDTERALTATASRRASIAVLPFSDQLTDASIRGGVADALAYDVTARLAKLRSMFVIAQGSTFALHEQRVGREEAGRLLGVDYVVNGSVRALRRRLVVTVELIETLSSRIVFSEVLDRRLDDAFLVLEEIGNTIVACVAGEIEMLERNRAILAPPNSLDAWQAHHRGLWHAYRFTKVDNDRAQHFFEMAVRLDPTFARAYAGLSFIHFQNAFQGWAARKPEIDRAYEFAGQSLMADDRDPAAHCALGRALWLRQRDEHAVDELQQAIELSPNFALAHYMLGFVQAQTGDATAAIKVADYSNKLSPFDPLLFGMHGSRALANTRLGKFDEAAAWAVKATSRPNAHLHMFAMAAFTHALAGALDEARAYAAMVRKELPGYGVDHFLGAFQLDQNGAELFRRAASKLGM